MSRVGARMGTALRIRDREQDVCICWHPRSKHILVMKEAGQERYLCIDCTCPNFKDVEQSTKEDIKEWADEAHRKMHTEQGEKMEQGKKFDGDKMRLDLIPTILLRGVAWILTFGAKKYGDRNWEQGILYHRVWGALLRHLMAWYDGEELDPESHKPHLWHAACNLSFLMHFEDNKDRYESFDDRPCQADRPFNS